MLTLCEPPGDEGGLGIDGPSTLPEGARLGVALLAGEEGGEAAEGHEVARVVPQRQLEGLDGLTSTVEHTQRLGAATQRMHEGRAVGQGRVIGVERPSKSVLERRRSPR